VFKRQRTTPAAVHARIGIRVANNRSRRSLYIRNR
jgi:hypothetical protein